jgi:hypothetical protein
MEIDIDDVEEFDEPSPAPIPSPSGLFRGRKRFLADLEEIRNMCIIGFGFQGYYLRSKFNLS